MNEEEVKKDAILEAIERRRKKSTLQMFIENPLETIRTKPYLLYYISTDVALIFAIISFFLYVSVMNIIVIAVLIAIMPPGLYDFYEKGRIKKLEAEFPALLRDIALSRKSGMTLGVAVSFAAKGEYGELTEAIKWVDNMMSWGVSFEEAMERFAKRYPTPLIRRSISIITEASMMGGEIGEILETVAVDAEETKALERKRSSETLPYIAIGYLSYFVFVAVILTICSQFIPMMEETARKAAGMQMPGFGFAVSERDIELYKMLFFHALLIQGLFTGLVTGKIGEGAIFAGLKHSVVFIIIGFITYSLLL